MRTVYEQLLLELRQGVRDEEKRLLNLACVDICRFREVTRFKQTVQMELINYRSHTTKEDLELIKLVEG
jgi:hypothetical protein